MALTCRLRVPITGYRGRNSRRRRMLGRGMRRHRRRRAISKRLGGGFLPALIPIIAAAIGAIPGIASVAVQASQRH
ncbi:protein X [Human adenovirus 16]|uniref:PX n=3 Tax=Human mastadenovirus B TaxID=108098 RepID=T1UJ77_9ADEN|nr:protein X [Human adenovirus 16]AET87228.1 protein X [Human adenovirus 68]AGT77294.1 X core protein [Human mastadenovirus B]AET87310.1 protein X [Human adenovirus 16]AJE59710.1 pX [Human mastadenovirus B]